MTSTKRIWKRFVDAASLYDVDYVTREWKFLGEVWFDEHKIKINKRYPKPERDLTLAHEIFHIIDSDLLGIDLDREIYTEYRARELVLGKEKLIYTCKKDKQKLMVGLIEPDVCDIVNYFRMHNKHGIRWERGLYEKR